jgi:hypothetical protein
MDILLNFKEAAEFLGVSQARVSMYRKDGRLVAVTVLGRPAFFKTQLEQFKAARGTGFKPGRPRKVVAK